MRYRSNRPKREYAVVPNAAMRDGALSIEARGMLALLMTYSDEWIFQRQHLMEVANIGRDRFQRIMRELIEAGYVNREPMRDLGGRVSGSTWVINDAPDREPENPAPGGTEGLKNRQPGLPTAGFSGPIRRTILKKEKDKEERARGVPSEASALVTDDGKAAQEGKDEGFQQFMDAHPRPSNRGRSLELWRAEKGRGVEAARIVQAARRYRSEMAGTGRQYAVPSDRWLEERRWQRVEGEKPCRASDDRPSGPADFWANEIRKGAYIAPSAIKPSVAREMLGRKLITSEQLRALGVSA